MVTGNNERRAFPRRFVDGGKKVRIVGETLEESGGKFHGIRLRMREFHHSHRHPCSRNLYEFGVCEE